MDLMKELAAMQENYLKKPMQDIRLFRPFWVEDEDPICVVYQEKKKLLQKGQLCFAHIVQANILLFKRFPPFDFPAHIVYSTDPEINDRPEILREIAWDLYTYKSQEPEKIPEQYRQIARVIADEYDRSGFTFTVDHEGHPISIHFIPVQIFRKLLPKRRLCGQFLPVLVTPGSKSVLILPKRYWTKDFKKLWCLGIV